MKFKLWIENSYLKITLITIIFMSLAVLGFSFSSGTETEHNVIAYILLFIYLIIIAYDCISYRRKFQEMVTPKENTKSSKNENSEIEFKNINDIYKAMRQRIEKEISLLSFRAYINLVIAAFGFIASIFFFSTIMESDKKIQEKLFTNLALSRISITVFIEVIVLFFLRMYKTNLDEIKYYQNEITSIEFKFLSLLDLAKLKDKKPLIEVYKEFAQTERNKIITKDQTTTHLEQLKEDFIKRISKKN